MQRLEDEGIPIGRGAYRRGGARLRPKHEDLDEDIQTHNTRLEQTDGGVLMSPGAAQRTCRFFSLSSRGYGDRLRV